MPQTLQVSASSPSCRFTDPKGIVSGKLLRANAAGPRRADGATFWQADLGSGHRLMCNYYTMRHDTSPNYPRSWALQVGSANSCRVFVCTAAMAHVYKWFSGAH